MTAALAEGGALAMLDITSLVVVTVHLSTSIC
jgi:hypothetical protein